MAEIIDGNTIDMVKENLAKLQEIYPEAFTEGKVDPQKLLLLLGEDVDSSNEKYSFTWKGKNDCIRLAQSSSKGTLLPCKEDSVDWDTTQNLYIEGDNLEVLKLLQKSYLGKIKMIYIDPPYNTGTDFVYHDDFADNIANYKQITGQAHKSNAESAGRYHTNWLNMIYPRLKLARTLLCDDGVIFISIDDNELENAKKVSDEVFGENNFITILTREAIKGGSLSKFLRVVNDYVLVYAKKIDNAVFGGIEVPGFVLDKVDEHGKYAKGRELNKWGVGARREDSPGMWFPVPGPNGEEIYPIRNDGSEGRWRLSRENILKMIEKGDVIYEQRDNGTYIIYEKIRDDSPRTKQFTNLFIDKYINSKGSEEIKKLFELNLSIFDYAKPVELIKDLMIMGSQDKDYIVLDFFSGSATTAHSVMQLNAEDGGNRKFIMVQLPEVCAEDSEAYKAGYKNICEIGKERIRRAGKLIKEQNSNVDTGFRVFKLDTSNLTKWNNTPTDDPNEVAKRINDSLFYLQPDRTDEDFVYEIMIKLGMPLSKNVELSTIEDKKVYGVKDGAYSILICLEYYVNFELVEKMAESEYEVLIFADRCFADANMLINTEEILKKKGKTLKLF